MNLTLKLAGMLFLLLVGVILGLQTAERGIHKVGGTPAEKQQTYYITKVDKAKTEVAPVGNQGGKQNQIESANYISQIGNMTGEWLRDSTNAIAKWISGFFEP
ncbi:DUF3679 domain-containing protein [Brevibacillus massiliensis]|uniref:DUF3679 domain-containing protein n=1 Tax=Brevibacillus massiliensis TaxID=1118054 RepID=UPI000474AB34|nr:DUF3679 domain-containing protein [Brevibacillus massiliensis]